MEHTKMETEVIEHVVAAATEIELHTLNELQLALVGGGIGDIVAG